jgi:hypothetical protein
MSIYTQYQTNPEFETKGVEVTYGNFRVVLARAGGSNKRYATILEQKTRPYRRAVQTGTLSNDVSLRLLKETFAEAVVLNWSTLVDGEWKQGIETPDGGLMPFSKENVLKIFEDLPDLFMEIQEQATSLALFKDEQAEADSKN